MAIQWGWKLTCDHPGCRKSLERWEDSGTPTLAHAGISKDGWFLYYLQEHERRHYARIRKHIVFCPEHAAEAREWHNAYLVWYGERREVGASVALSLRERLAEAICPVDSRSTHISIAVCDWVREHPAPKPPWRG